MDKRTVFGKILRIVGIILLGLTAVFHILGGVGTSCVALGAEKYDSMAGIVPYKWLYQVFVLVTIAIGVWGVQATIKLARSKEQSFRNALLVLLIGLIVSGVHMAASEALRGKSAPANVRVYLNALTLVVFLLFMIPWLWKQIRFEKADEKRDTGSDVGIAAIMAGITILTVHLWAGPTHMMDGINYADVWHTELSFVGWGVIILGVAFIAWRLISPGVHLAAVEEGSI
jgi:hypothetical protein